MSSKPGFAALAASFALAGCATHPLGQPGASAPVLHEVATEYSPALACLGDAIDRSGKPRLILHVGHVEDRTVPLRYDERGLSHGGAWWLHTAIEKIGSKKVVSSIRRETSKTDGNVLSLSGAWTQDDHGVTRSDGEIGGGGLLGNQRVDASVGARFEQSVIAGDFLSTRRGMVSHASAISVAINAQRSGFSLGIQDGATRFAVEFTQQNVDGPHFAQRRVAEAAVLVHVAHAFDLDYRACLEQGWARPLAAPRVEGSPSASSSASVPRAPRSAGASRVEASTSKPNLRSAPSPTSASGSTAPDSSSAQARFNALDAAGRTRAVQQKLVAAGYLKSAPDGVWGAQSRAALQRFERDQKRPQRGVPDAQAYAALEAAEPRGLAALGAWLRRSTAAVLEAPSRQAGQ